MKKRIFIYAVLHHGIKDGQVDTKIVIEPKAILAASDTEVRILVSRLLPECVLKDLENVEVMVRPF